MSTSIAVVSVGDARANKIGSSGAARRHRRRPHECRRLLAKCSQDSAGSNGSNAPQSATANTTLHGLIEREGGLVVPGVYDSLSALIAEKVGFKAAFLSGYALSAASLGKPDVGLVTEPEKADVARKMCSAVQDLPILADADTGGGNALNVHRTVRDLISAGAKGCILEDQVWPKRCGTTLRGKAVVPMEEHALKIAAAKDAAMGHDFFVIARTDARSTSAKRGLEYAIQRVNSYYEAGADATLIEAPRSVEELQTIVNETSGLRAINMIENGVTPLLPAQELHNMGFKIVMNPLSALLAATKQIFSIYTSLYQQGTTNKNLSDIAELDVSQGYTFHRMFNNFYSCQSSLLRKQDVREVLKLEEVYALEDRYYIVEESKAATLKYYARVGHKYSLVDMSKSDEE